MPGPGGCVGGCLRVAARGMAVGGRFRGASGTPPPTVCPGKGGSGSLPLIRPCGATFPRGGRQGLQGRDSSLPGKGGSGRSRRGGGTPPYVWGDMETLWGLRGQSFPGRRAVGAGHARPGGLRGHPSMVRSVGRGLDPSAGCWRQRESPRVVTRGRTSAQASAGRRGRRPLRFARGRAAVGACPSSGPAGPPSPEGEGKGCMAAAGAAPYPGSWSSVRSWRVRL